MPKITETTRIAKNAAALWYDVGRFQAVGDRHPMLANVETTGEREGALRTAEGRDGSKQVERLMHIAPSEHFYRYEMEATTALPVSDYVGEFRINDEGDGTSTVIWSAEFKDTSNDGGGSTSTQAFLKAGVDKLKALYGAPHAKGGA